MRVAMVTETYPPEVNGVARTIDLMAEGLKSASGAKSAPASALKKKRAPTGPHLSRLA